MGSNNISGTVIMPSDHTKIRAWHVTFSFYNKPIGDFILCYLHVFSTYVFVFHSIYLLDLWHQDD